ncbi:hypothetical protein LWI28_008329 [Acer negundo]|uniref:Uncharacterized protein n=1 Tax=Acer negundo TaxID=4023 RepID=A0AAD5P5K4_ACENE|nr:hypothetical protein LWI28_008329 [Acer negundo]
MGGVPTGRFSNGKVPSDFLVEELGIKELLPAYLDPNLKPEDLLTGVSFASGGSGYDPATAKLEFATPLFNQLQQFQEYKEKLKVIAGEEGTNTILSKSLFVVVASSNDIANTYFNFRIREFQFNLFTYTDLLVGSASSFLQQLYGLGARRIAVFGAPPLGCLPSTRTLAGGGSRKECVEIYNQAAQSFNSKLSAQIDSLNSNIPEAELIYVDIYNPLLDLIQNSNNFGFEVVDRGCCGTGTIEASILCNQLSPHTCTDVYEAARELAGNNEFPAVIFFGDSIVDPGNNNNRLFALAKSNFPPYGRDFIGGVATGRFSNGKIPSDFIVEKLGIKELLPAYLDPNLRPEDLLTGVSFASGGCGYDPLTSELVSAISFEDQLKMFQEYIEKLKEIAGEESTSTILTKGLFGVVGSSNDIANVYFDTHIRQLQYNIFNYTDFLVGSASTFLQKLYGLGARKIAVFGAPPLGCLPASITFAGEIISREKCIEVYNQAAKLFSDKLSAEVDRLNINLADVKLVYIDIYDPLLDLIQNPNKYVEKLGIKELLPPYLDPNLKPEDLLTGVSFASGASGYDSLTSELVKPKNHLPCNTFWYCPKISNTTINAASIHGKNPSDKQQLRLRQHPPVRGIEKYVFETWFEDNRHLISVTRATEVTKRDKGEFGFTVKNSKEK